MARAQLCPYRVYCSLCVNLTMTAGISAMAEDIMRDPSQVQLVKSQVSIMRDTSQVKLVKSQVSITCKELSYYPAEVVYVMFSSHE